MGLENADFIKELVATNPQGIDPVSEGDDHLTAIKRALKNGFPNFEGDQQEAKSVLLTEDQINDALQKMVGGTITGDVTVDALLQVLNRGSRTNSFIVAGGNDPADETQRALRVYSALFGNTLESQTEPAVGGYLIINASTNAAGDFTGSENFRPIVALQVFGTTVLAAEEGDKGGVHLWERGGAKVRAGFRNPQARDLGANHTVEPADESRALVFNAVGDVTLTVPAAEVIGTELTVINRSTTGTVNIAGSGVALEYFSGGNSSSGPLTLDPLSVCQLYYRATNICCVWGNGVSGP